MASRKGIILAGDNGTSFSPMAASIPPCLLSVYDKPMIYYAFSVLFQAGIRDIAIVASKVAQETLAPMLGTVRDLGISVSLFDDGGASSVQAAYVTVEGFLGRAPSALVLANNIFSGPGLTAQLRRATKRTARSTIFTYPTLEPADHPVVAFNPQARGDRLHQPPHKPVSDRAVTGLYFLDCHASRRARMHLDQSNGLASFLNGYLTDGLLEIEPLGVSSSWFDIRSPDKMLDASGFVRSQLVDHGTRMGCIEEVAFQSGFISARTLLKLADRHGDASYGKRLRRLAQRGRREGTPVDTLV